MAVTETIQELLQGIDEAQYGRDMRQYIHKGIQKCYEEGSAGETDLVARESVEKILEIFGDVESSSTASKDYAVGDSLIYDGRLYKVISAIEEGDTFTEGTNIEETRASSNIGNMYTIPYRTTTQSWIPEKDITVYIIPSIRMMYIDIAFTTNAHEAISGVTIADRLPKPRHIGGLYFKSVFTNLWTYASSSSAIAYISTSNSSSASDDDNVLQINLPALASGTAHYEGQIITFYTDLNSYYPFSEAQLVTT